jgi:hypothetical protein
MQSMGAPSLGGLQYFASSKTTIAADTSQSSTELTIRFSESVRLWHIGARFALKGQSEAAASFRSVFVAQTHQELNERHEAQQQKNKAST